MRFARELDGCELAVHPRSGGDLEGAGAPVTVAERQNVERRRVPGLVQRRRRLARFARPSAPLASPQSSSTIGRGRPVTPCPLSAEDDHTRPPCAPARRSRQLHLADPAVGDGCCLGRNGLGEQDEAGGLSIAPTGQLALVALRTVPMLEPFRDLAINPGHTWEPPTNTS